jgi:hypothetical protein
MKPANIENTIVDEANGVTYVVMAPRVLTDGEVFSAIRIAILMRGRKRPARGETLTISTDCAN